MQRFRGFIHRESSQQTSSPATFRSRIPMELKECLAWSCNVLVDLGPGKQKNPGRPAPRVCFGAVASYLPYIERLLGCWLGPALKPAGERVSHQLFQNNLEVAAPLAPSLSARPRFDAQTRPGSEIAVQGAASLSRTWSSPFHPIGIDILRA